MALRIAFLGTPDFAVPSLQALVAAGHRVIAVFTQPDRPRGRGHEPAACPVKQAAIGLNIPVHQPVKIRQPETVELLRGLNLDAMAVVAYGQIIPQSIIDVPPLGIINVHGSLLQKYRGAAPIQWAIAEGETRTGVTTMRIDAGLDTGDILLAWECEIGPDETAAELSVRLAEAGAGLLVKTLDGLASGLVKPVAQDHSQASHAPTLKKEDGLVDWTWPAARIHNRVRGFQPWPGAYTSFRGELLKIWRTARTMTFTEADPGEVLAEGGRMFVACGDGRAIELLEVQLAGGKRLSASVFLNGHPLREEEILGQSTS